MLLQNPSKSCTLIFVLLFVACHGETIPGGEIKIRNDILDKEFNSFQIDHVVAKQGLTGFQKELTPGEEITLPFKDIRSLQFSRKYSDHTNIYIVSCPTEMNSRVLMKLIDVHTNRLGGGCRLTRKGHITTRGSVKWE